MAKITPLTSFWQVYEFCHNQEREALVTSISEPEDYWNDLIWIRTKALLDTTSAGETIERYFRVLNQKEFTRPQELKSANDFYQGRLNGISCIVNFCQLVELLRTNLPDSSEFQEIKEYLHHSLTKGSLKEFPRLVSHFSLTNLANTDDYLVERTVSLSKQLELF